MPSAQGDLWLLSEPGRAGEAVPLLASLKAGRLALCPGDLWPLSERGRAGEAAPAAPGRGRAEPGAGAALGSGDELHQQPLQKDPFICIQ